VSDKEDVIELLASENTFRIFTIDMLYVGLSKVAKRPICVTDVGNND